MYNCKSDPLGGLFDMLWISPFYISVIVDLCLNGYLKKPNDLRPKSPGTELVPCRYDDGLSRVSPEFIVASPRWPILYVMRVLATGG